MTESNRNGADRRLTFTQDPYTHQYVLELSAATGMTKADLYNLSMKVLALLVGAHRRGVEFMIRDIRSGRSVHDPALSVLLGNVLTALARRDEQAGS
ncbi:hypothetical protein [Nocardia asiatica]